MVDENGKFKFLDFTGYREIVLGKGEKRDRRSDGTSHLIYSVAVPASYLSGYTNPTLLHRPSLIVCKPAGRPRDHGGVGVSTLAFLCCPEPYEDIWNVPLNRPKTSDSWL